MDLVLKGILLGLTLSVMTGPIFITLVQTSIERGFRAGISVASGFWVSDLLYIIVVSSAISFLIGLAAVDHFEIYIGLIGGTILAGFGVALLLYGKIPARPGHIKKPKSSSTYLGLWTLGFFMNTLNPGTILFWIGITSIISERLQLELSESFPFFIGLIVTIVITDIVKVALAKRISYYLTPRVIITVRKIAGLVLLGFGVMLFIRVVFQLL